MYKTSNIYCLPLDRSVLGPGISGLSVISLMGYRQRHVGMEGSKGLKGQGGLAFVFAMTVR